MTGHTLSLTPALRSFLAAKRREPDGDLLRRFLVARDEAAFAELMGRHGPMVLGVSRRVARDAHAAEDVFQATFLLLARSGATIRRPEALGAWLHQTAFRLALRARGARALHQTIPPGTLDPARDPLDDLSARELLAVLDDELGRLPEDHRTAVVLCCLEGLSLDEAAQRLGWTRGSVKGRLERARARLRERLDERGLGLPSALAAPLLASPCLVVPAALTDATLALVRGAPAPPVIRALAEGGARAASFARLHGPWAAFLLAGSLALAALLPGDRPAVTTPAVKPPAGRPREPLPPGARLRLGEMERRAVGTKIAFTADGRSIVGIRDAKRLTVWDAATGKVREVREVAGAGYGCCELSPDGRWMLTDQAPGKHAGFRLFLWDLRTGKVVRDFPMTGASWLNRATFSPTGEHVAAVAEVGDKRHVHVWSLDGQERLRARLETREACRQVVFSPDGRHLLIPSPFARGIYCWDLPGKRLLWQKNILCATLAVTPGGTVICPVMPKRPAAIDLRTGNNRPDVKLPPLLRYHHLLVSPDGKRLLEAGRAGVDVWDLESCKKLHTLPGSSAEMVLAPDGKSVLVNTGALQRWDLASGRAHFAEEEGHTDAVGWLAFSGDGRRLASGSPDGSVRTWDTVTGKPLRTWRGYRGRGLSPLGGPTYGGVTALDMSPDGRWVLVAGKDDDQLRLWDASTGKEAAVLRIIDGRDGERTPQVYQLRVSRDGRTATGLVGFHTGFVGEIHPEGFLMRWDLRAGKGVRVAELKETIRSPSDFAADGRWFVVASRVRDAATGKEISQLQGLAKKGDECECSFSPDGLLLAGWPSPEGKRMDPADGSGVRVWEALTGKVVAEFTIPRRFGEWRWHPGGRLIAVNNRDAIRLWDVRRGKLAKEWPLPEGSVVGASACTFCFSPDGRALATGLGDGTILLWDVPMPGGKPAPLRPTELDWLWEELRNEDAKKAWEAAWRLADFPKEAVAFLAKHLAPVRPAPAAVTRPLLADLGSDSFRRREEATKRLLALGPRAEPALRTALAAGPDLESKRRIEKLLAALAGTPALTAEQMRDLRAAAMLGWVGTEDAGKVLTSLAGGVPSAPLTRQAKTALGRR